LTSDLGADSSNLLDAAGMLVDFGLTLNQARVYLSIVQLGCSTIGNISRESGVRREDVYRIIPKLEKMWLIERVPSTPTKIVYTNRGSFVLFDRAKKGVGK
jgi:sugar-specific transcriptional regulator TrmB